MFSINIFLRLLTLFLFVVREFYWKCAERNADKERPKTSTHTKQGVVERIVYRVALLLLALQLLGLQLFSFPYSSILQFIGFTVVSMSVIISIIARKELGVNWAHAKDHQIKKNQELVTSGIYSYIRHPIYLGVLLSYGGAEIVAQSYLSIVFFCIFFAGAYIQGKREEKILLKYFGKEYEEYMKKTRMFIPYIV